jgi:hypothetical protein
MTLRATISRAALALTAWTALDGRSGNDGEHGKRRSPPQRCRAPTISNPQSRPSMCDLAKNSGSGSLLVTVHGM